MGERMPTISEDKVYDDEDTEETEMENMIVALNDEREKLNESLQLLKDENDDIKAKYAEASAERDFLKRQLSKGVPSDIASLTKELGHAQSLVKEQQAEISEFQAERNNTRFLIEHLEALVSRHERSFRLTLVKRQYQQNAGVSSEVEVLKALKSLFEHHKILDEKIKKKLKESIERGMQMEEMLEASYGENKLLRGQLSQLKISLSQRSDKDKSGVGSDESGEILEEASRVVQLENIIETQKSELDVGRRQLSVTLSKLSGLEQDLDIARTDLMKSEQTIIRLQKELRDIQMNRQELEDRVATLERRYLNTQREATSVHELRDRLESELANRDDLLQQAEERNSILQDRLKAAESKLQQSLRRAEALPEVEAELAQRVAALTKAEERHGNIEEKLKSLETRLEEKSQELSRAHQRDKMNEDHNQRLTSTVDRLLAESNERLQLHLKERMTTLEEKNNLQSELEGLRKVYDECRLEKEVLARSLDKVESDYLRKNKSFDRSASGVQLSATSSSSASMSSSWKPNHNTSNTLDVRGRQQHVNHTSANGAPSNHTSYLRDYSGKSNTMPSRKSDKPLADWERSLQSSFLDSNHEVEGELGEHIFSAVDLRSSPGQANNSFSLAGMLQDQLDAVNREISALQKQRQSTDGRNDSANDSYGYNSLPRTYNNQDDSYPAMVDSDLRSQTLPHHHSQPADVGLNHQNNQITIPNWSFEKIGAFPVDQDDSKSSQEDGSSGTPTSSSFGSQESIPHPNQTTMAPLATTKKRGRIKSSIERLFKKKQKVREACDGLNFQYSI